MDVLCPNLAADARAVDPKYTGLETSWNDVQRGVVAPSLSKEPPQLSCLGRNITDTRLTSKDGHVIPFVRPDNKDEWLGVLDPKELVVTPEGESLCDFLGNLSKNISYAGYSLSNADEAKVPDRVAIRMQEAYVGIRTGETRQVAPSNFSYQTSDPDDPCNLLLVFTSSGWYVSVDGVGFKPLYANEVKDDGQTMVHSWMQVSASDLRVGDTTEEDVKQERSPSKKAKTSTIGIRGCVPRNNRMIVVTVPLEQKPVSMQPSYGAAKGGAFVSTFDPWNEDGEGVTYRSCGADDDDMTTAPVGTSRAALMDVGEEAEKTQVKSMNLALSKNQPVVVTQITYNTVSTGSAGGASAVKVGKEDVERSIKDMNGQYDLCESQCKLSCLPAMLHAFEKEDAAKIQETLEAVRKKKIDGAKKSADENPFKPNADALLVFSK